MDLANSLMRRHCSSANATCTNDYAAKCSYHGRFLERGVSERQQVDPFRENGPRRGRIQPKHRTSGLFPSRVLVPTAKTTFFAESDLLGSSRRRDRHPGRAPGLPKSTKPGRKKPSRPR